LSQNDRERVLGRVRAGKLRFLVATDVAARGIDIPELSHVFQYEMPEDVEVYIHRAGRTGRAGASGEAIALIDILELGKLKRIGLKYEIDFQERPLPTDEDVADVVSERTTVLLEAKQRTRDKLKAERMQRFVPLAKTLSEDEEGLELLAMLIDDYYQESLHAPPPITETASSQSSANTQSSKKRQRRRGNNRRS
jgi:ATP-dependent RNA helicase DeaD